MLVNNKKKSVGWGIIILLCTIGLMIIKKISNYSLNRLVIYTFFLNGILWIYLFHKEIKKTQSKCMCKNNAIPDIFQGAHRKERKLRKLKISGKFFSECILFYA